MEKISEQYSLNHHNSRRAKEDGWWDMYSSEGLDDEQVYDEDSVTKNYIMWKPSQKGGIAKRR